MKRRRKGVTVHLVRGSGGRYVIAWRDDWNDPGWRSSVVVRDGVSAVSQELTRGETLKDLVEKGVPTFATHNGASRRARQLGL